jgi:hypothetical protein
VVSKPQLLEAALDKHQASFSAICYDLPMPGLFSVVEGNPGCHVTQLQPLKLGCSSEGWRQVLGDSDASFLFLQPGRQGAQLSLQAADSVASVASDNAML